MTRWTRERVGSLAPDIASLTAARKLAMPGPWSDTGSSETLLWGKCQGSGKTPYQVSVDLTGPAFRCSCPSRKFPCKHALALMLLWVEGPAAVPDGIDPAAFAADWAADWAAERAAKAAAETSKPPRKPPDPAARAKRVEDRLALMDGGMVDFALWLGDLMRAGTAAARQQPYAWWDGTAARLVDAQLPGLAAQVRDIASDVRSRDDWAAHLLSSAGRWWTATHAWAGRDTLSQDELGDLRAYIGWPYSSEEIVAADSVSDNWLVLGAHRSDDGRIEQQRTWLAGEATHQVVQVLDFAAGGAPLPVAHTVGSVVSATVARYPGTLCRRARFVDAPVPVRDADALPFGGSVGDAMQTAADAWAVNPWAASVPAVLSGVQMSATHLVGPDLAGLPLLPGTTAWLGLAVSGGAPVTVFVELEERGARPLTVQTGGQLVAL